MESGNLKSNERKMLIYLLKQAEKRIYLLRISLYGDTGKYFPDGNIMWKEKFEIENDEFENKYKLSEQDYRLTIESCEIETCIRRILHGLTEMKTYNPLKDVIMELENESNAFKKHKKMIETKRKQIDQLKEVLPVLQDQAQVTAQHLKTRKLDKVDAAEAIEPYSEIEFLKKLMNYKVESRKAFYDQKQGELKDTIEWFERETRTQEHADIQTISFWLIKYDECSEKLDLMLKQLFDTWSARRRELEILKKYRKINLEKIQKLRKLISECEDYIEKDTAEKKEQQKKREAELKKQMAATLIQAFWRGTMVRKHLGPYKVKKSKKGKGKKGKGKKKK